MTLRTEKTMKPERRHFKVDRLEIRGTGDGQTVRGLAVPYNRKSGDMGGWQEVIRESAASDALANNDITLLWQHDVSQPISRIGATRAALVLEERKTGIWFEQDSSAFSDYQLAKIADGVVREMSFGFYAEEQTWQEDAKPMVLREITRMNLVEISPVTNAAYGTSTKVAVRCAEAAGIVFPCKGITLDETSPDMDATPAAVQQQLRAQQAMNVARLRGGF